MKILRMYLWRHFDANFKHQLPEKSQVACRSHVSLSGLWTMSAGCPRCKHLRDIGFASDHLPLLICPVNTNYWKKGIEEYKYLCLFKSIYIYAPQLHHCIGSCSFLHARLVDASIPQRCELSFVGGSWHIEKWTVQLLFVDMSGSASTARCLTLAQQRCRCAHFAEFNSQSTWSLMFP